VDELTIQAGLSGTIAANGDGAAYSLAERPHTWATGPEVVALVLARAELRGVRVRRADGELDGRALKRANHIASLYDVARRRVAAAGAGPLFTLSKGQAATELYDDCRGDRDAQARKKRSVAGWLDELYELGLFLRVMTQVSERGQDQCLLLQLQPVPGHAAALAEHYGLVRRGETRRQRHERRVRPLCRRGGRKSVNRYVGARTPGRTPARDVCDAVRVDPRRWSSAAARPGPRSLSPKQSAPPWAPPPGVPPTGGPPGRRSSWVYLSARNLRHRSWRGARGRSRHDRAQSSSCGDHGRDRAGLVKGHRRREPERT
jgi:hypothetical protein